MESDSGTRNRKARGIHFADRGLLIFTYPSLPDLSAGQSFEVTFWYQISLPTRQHWTLNRTGGNLVHTRMAGGWLVAFVTLAA